MRLISETITTGAAQNLSGSSTNTGFFLYGYPEYTIIKPGWTCVQTGAVVTVVGDGISNYDITTVGAPFVSGSFYSFTGPTGLELLGGMKIITTPPPPPSNGSLAFSSATSQSLTVPANAGFNFGTSNFTIEFWAYPTNLASGNGDMLVMQNGSAYMIVGQANTDGRIRVNWNNTPTTGSPFNSFSSTIGTFAQNTWQHICTMRNGNSYSLFINGVCRGTVSGVSSAQMGSSALPWNIAQDQGGNRFNGNFTNLRIVKGSLVYTYGTTVGTTYFTPPTSYLTAISGTQLLMYMSDSDYLVDSSSNNLTATKTGTPTVSGLTPF